MEWISTMSQRIQKQEIARRLAGRMNSDEETASQWIEAMIDTLYEAFKAGESVTLEGFGDSTCGPSARAGTFASSQGRRCALFSWSSTYRGER